MRVPAKPRASRKTCHAHGQSSPGGLAEQAQIVTEARSALVAGAPVRALALVRSTRAWRSGALEPEELAIEARAMRAMGRADEAVAADLELKIKYPALARTLAR